MPVLFIIKNFKKTESYVVVLRQGLILQIYLSMSKTLKAMRKRNFREIAMLQKLHLKLN